ncbi:MAG: alcohol dehydrogenase catalytic domain-containing protein [Candidatus Saccharibacteria bacterium]|nr:alcohol dehydrogenase catalytic domain-containing protein [Microbacteriaceae bacterium]
MRVVTWEGIRSVEVSTVEVPLLGPGDVILDVAVCGICGSDVHSFAEGAWIVKGMPLGHEFAGVVREVGAKVKNIVVGDRVTVNPASYCGNCDRCRDQHENMCENMSGAAGGFSDRVLIPSARRDVNVFVLPDGVSFEAAAFLEPLSVAMRAVNQLQPPLDEPILVTGLGTIGQCVVQILAAQGASTIVAIDTSAIRREGALASGATEVLDPADADIVDLLLAKYGVTHSPYRERSGAFASAFECAGASPVFDQIFQLVRSAGSVSLVALTAEPVMLDPNPIVQKEIRVLGSFAYSTEDVKAAFNLIATQAVNPEILITHRFSLDEIGDAFETQSRSNDSIKVMVHP